MLKGMSSVMRVMIRDVVSLSARALELFIEALIVKSTQVTRINNARTLSASHMYSTRALALAYLLTCMIQSLSDCQSPLCVRAPRDNCCNVEMRRAVSLSDCQSPLCVRAPRDNCCNVEMRRDVSLSL